MPNLPRLLFVSSSTLLLLTSLTTLAIKSQNLSYILTNVRLTDPTRYILPPASYWIQNPISIQSASISTLLAILSLLFAAFLWPNTGNRPGSPIPFYNIVYPIVSFGTALDSLIALFETFLLHNSSATLPQGMSNKSPMVVFEDQETAYLVFDVETWTCAFSDGGWGGVFEGQCALERAGRWVMVPFCVVGFVVVVLGTVALILERVEEKRRRGWGVDGVGVAERGEYF